MAGRITSIFVSKWVKPRTMVVTSLAVCIGAAVIIVAFGTYSKFGVYAGTGAMFKAFSRIFGACDMLVSSGM